MAQGGFGVASATRRGKEEEGGDQDLALTPQGEKTGSDKKEREGGKR